MNTEKFEIAKEQYKLLFPVSPFFETWIPKSHFISTEYDGKNLSITRRDEKVYGMAFGASPSISEEWQSLSIETRGVAAMCRWQSGRVVISSVATDKDRRGEGIGKQVMRACLAAGYELGEDFLSLGVMHANISAHRLYQSVGFTLMHNFTYCERR